MNMTWADLRARLFEAGASDETVEAIRRATAGSRHAERVRIARDSAIEAARTHLGGACAEGEEQAVAALLLVIELNGAGGPGGLGGPMCATTRMPFARAWGKGRRHASDGAAWDAAAREALRGLARQADVGWARVPGLPHELGMVADAGLAPEKVRSLARSRELVPQHFALAVARASLLAILEAEAEGRTPVLDVGEAPGNLLVEITGTEAEWASVCAELEASAAE